MKKPDKLKIFIHKLQHWEYWPMWTLYVPVVPLWAYHAIRNGGFYTFTATNPGIKNGGMYNVGKMSIYELLPPESFPKTILIKDQIFEQVTDQVDKAGISFPLIVKPDMGMRGILVKKIENTDQLKKYHEQLHLDYLVQEYIDYPNEAGIFYVRIPGTINGKIIGITTKQFMRITGDGQSSIRQLMLENPRFAMQISRLESATDLDQIPPKGAKIYLQPIGNHNLGTCFTDGMLHHTQELEQTIDHICRKLPGFFYGRLDLRFNSWEELAKGINFSIIEVNGCLSEPTQIYDPKYSYWNALKEIYRHHHIMFRIAAENIKTGIKKGRFADDFGEMVKHFRYADKITKLAGKLHLH